MAENKNAQQVREITDKLEQGIKELFESERFKEYLRTMSKFYNYSFNNTLLIAMQKPDATLIAGYTSWKKNFDRHVKKDEKSIKILAPAPYKAKEDRVKVDPDTQKPVLDADGKPVTETVEVMRPAFKVVSVFDVSQTDGKELPDIMVDQLTGDVEQYEDFWRVLKEISPVPVGLEKIEGGAHGYYHLVDKRIAIDDGMSEMQTIKTLIHEIAHAKLHALDPDASTAEKKDRHTKEVEAESVAYTVCQRYGIETSDYSFGYIAGWSSDKETKELKSSLETIRSTAAEMIESIDTKLRALMMDRNQEQKTEIAVSIGEKGYIEVHETDGGFDYSLYGADRKLKDGGFVPDEDTTAKSIMESLCVELGVLDSDVTVQDYEAFQEQAASANEIKPSFLEVPVYREMANYAYEAGELDAYRASHDANTACAEAIGAAISNNYGDNRLSAEAAVKGVLEQFSPERVQYVLANTIQQKAYDGRISGDLKQWAKGTDVCSEYASAFIVDKVNPGLLDLFAAEFCRQTDPVPTVEAPATPKQRLTAEEKQIKDAVMDSLKGQIAHANDGMRSTYKVSMQSHKVMIQNNVRIEGNTVTKDGEPMFLIHRRHSAKKTQGCYRELIPTLEYVRREKAQSVKQEKPSIREQLRSAAKSQPERKSPQKKKTHDIGLE